MKVFILLDLFNLFMFILFVIVLMISQICHIGSLERAFVLLCILFSVCPSLIACLQIFTIC